MSFGERGAGQPEAIKAWFYPGETWGQEFVYPKRRAIELAKIVNEPVLAMPIETASAEVPVETLKTVQVAAIEPTGEEVPVAAVVEPPPAAPATLVAQALPETASSLPLFALIGALSLFAGFSLLILTKRSA
jgi:LPXTG-motif cell wall-anchored protein